MLPHGLEIDTNKQRLPVEMIHAYLNTTYWASQRSLDTVARTIEHSLNFGLYLDGQFIGFARVISDFAVFAYLCDVFILPEHQGKGYGKVLMGYIHQYPELQPMRRWLLATKDAHGLYEQFGYTPLVNEHRWMEKFRDDL